MWINLDDGQLAIVEDALQRRCETLKEGRVILPAGWANARELLEDKINTIDGALVKLREASAGFNPSDPYRAYLQTQADNDMEVDEDAVVSRGSDPGAFVMAWIWVRNDEAGVPDPDDEDEDKCRTCGEHYEDGGDGFDGECPSCADKTDQKLNPENYID